MRGLYRLPRRGSTSGKRRHRVGADNLNDYYDVRLKEARLARLRERPGFGFYRVDISDKQAVGDMVAGHSDISQIVHLAAQAGVRHSLVDPYAYVQANVMGHLVVLEAARRLPGLRHLVYASTSSVYGLNDSLPFRETDRVDTPVSLYAATKRADELMSHAYAHLFGLPQTGLRFFTVYGPWGRPDMAYFSFAQSIMAGEPITLYDGGPAEARFHLHRRHRRRNSGQLGSAAGGCRYSEVAEHRQSPSGGGARTCAAAGGSSRSEGNHSFSAAAISGRRGDVCVG